MGVVGKGTSKDWKQVASNTAVNTGKTKWGVVDHFVGLFCRMWVEIRISGLFGLFVSSSLVAFAEHSPFPRQWNDTFLPLEWKQV
jgi:hypothetical protein